jgi:hypothetical protein
MFKFSINIRKLDPVIDYLKSVPRGAVKVALPAIAEWFIGDGRRGLKHYPVYRHITRALAYPDMSFTTSTGKTIIGYKSLRQFRYVMASIAQGRMLPGFPRRTGNTQRGYTMVTSNRGYRVRIINETRGAIYTRHDTLQARLNAMAGWRKAGDVISTNIKGALRHARSKVSVWLKRKGK